MKGVNKMSNIDILEKAIEIDIMEFNKNMALMEDADYIAFVEGDYYEESGNNKENFFDKAIAYIRDLIKKIKDKISEKFSDANVKKQQEKLKMEILSDPNKKNKKVKVQINDKVYDLDKKALSDLSKCKTKEEVEKYMSDYKKKREKLIAGSIVAVSAATAIGILGSKLHKTHKQLDGLQEEYERSILTLGANAKEISKLNKDNDDLRGKLRKSEHLAKERDETIKNMKGVIKGIKNDVDTISATADYNDVFGNPKKIYSRVYSENIKRYAGNMDKAHNTTINDISEIVVSNMNDIIRMSSEMTAKIGTILS